MKKAVSLILALGMLLSLCACGATAKKLTTKQVEDALADCSGELSMDSNGNSVNGFTYVIDDANVDDLVDRSYTQKALERMLSGDTANLMYGQYKVCKSVLATMCIVSLFRDDEENFNVEDYLDEIFSIICDGKSAEYNGWTVSPELDSDNDVVTITVTSK